jgi:predicted short-subunit dehydrogenase-like oxidoreductase (DUF2520 family)
MKSISIIGCGRVGKTLGRAWHSSGFYRVQDVLTRSLASAEQAVAFMGAGRATTNLADLRPADVWMLAVPDDQIAQTTVALAQTAASWAKSDPANPGKPPAIAFHCSGALASTELASLRTLGWQLASAHCLLSFADPGTALQQLAGSPCALEGDPSATLALEPALAHAASRWRPSTSCCITRGPYLRPIFCQCYKT